VLGELFDNGAVFFLIFVRILALIQVAPLLNSSGVPYIAKVGLAGLAAFLVFPWMVDSYPIPPSGLQYFLLVFGEALVGIITGFILVLAYAAFQVAGQFFSLQMGFGASQVFDPMAQIQIPIMGQFLNLVAMFIFLTVGGFQKLFLTGVVHSFQAFRAVDLVIYREDLLQVLLQGLSRLFEHAMVIAFPILGTLFLVSLTMGLLAKAAPQMNLLMLGFPLAIGVAFLIIFLAMPFLAEVFSRVVEQSFETLYRVFAVEGGLR
jgi:flagellar biosynthetic protein FliR